MTILVGWQEQYGRMMRSHERLSDFAEGRVSASSDDARDALFHFFQDAYHLRDWIKNDPTVIKSDVEKWIDNTDSLRLCADLCNGTKHLRLTSAKTKDLSTSFESQSVTVRPSPVGSGRPGDASLHGWTVVSGGQSHDAVELSGRVVSAWRTWLRGEGLL
jgi:hypothetical protein